MCKKLVYLILTLVLASASYGGQVIGDWEQNMDGWTAVSWDTPNPTFGYSNTTGVTLNEWSLIVTPGKTGFQWSMQRDGILDIDTNPMFEIDVTWVASEWDDGGSGNAWACFSQIAINSDNGWKDFGSSYMTDPLNPSYPGCWDPYSWGEVHTRHLVWDISEYDMSGITWMQFYMSTNNGNLASVGNYYLDNAQLTPEPATIALLGLGALALVRRKR